MEKRFQIGNYTQSGYNPDYPHNIFIWKLGDIIPEWLSDRAKVVFLDGDGNITLDFIETSSGGLSIRSSNGVDILVNLKKKADFVCFSSESEKIFSLSKIQLDLLYKPLN